MNHNIKVDFIKLKKDIDKQSSAALLGLEKSNKGKNAEMGIIYTHMD